MQAERAAGRFGPCLPGGVCGLSTARDAPAQENVGPRFVDTPPAGEQSLCRMAAHPLHHSFQHDHPREAALLRAIRKMPHLLNNSVMLRDEVPLTIRCKSQALSFALAAQPAGRPMLGSMPSAGFHRGDNAPYPPVRQFIQRCECKTRPVVLPCE